MFQITDEDNYYFIYKMEQQTVQKLTINKTKIVIYNQVS